MFEEKGKFVDLDRSEIYPEVVDSLTGLNVLATMGLFDGNRFSFTEIECR